VLRGHRSHEQQDDDTNEDISSISIPEIVSPMGPFVTAASASLEHNKSEGPRVLSCIIVYNLSSPSPSLAVVRGGSRIIIAYTTTLCGEFRRSIVFWRNG
jgi:hypothetical protein